MLAWILALGLGGLALFGAGAGTIWAVKESGVATCNAEWQTKLQEKNAEVLAANSKTEIAVRSTEARAKEHMTALVIRLNAMEQEVVDAREKVPLSEVCNACRVPGEWVWGVRRDAPTATPTPPVAASQQPTKSGRKIIKAPAGSKVSNKKARLLRDRAGKSEGVRVPTEKTD